MRGTGHFASRSHHPQRLWLWFCPRLACPADLRCIPYVFKAAPGTFLSAGQKKRSGDYEPLARERVQQEITRVSAGRGLANADVPRPVIPPGSGNVNCKRVAFGMCTAVTAAHSCTTALTPSTVGLAVCAFGLCLQLHHC
jgi:hypothetical protein